MLSEEDYFFHLESEDWPAYLEENGYCVIRAIAQADEIESAISAIWDDLGQLFDARIDDPRSWSRIPCGSCGIMSNKSIPQTRGPWIIRSLESLRSVFRRIWSTDELIVSMDSIIMWLPWWINYSWHPVSEGLHIDQNPFFKPEKSCVQGMVALTDVSSDIGGLQVLPRSHLPDAKKVFMDSHPHLSAFPSDWCVLRSEEQRTQQPFARLLKARAGDLILWDSRTVHGAWVGNGPQYSAEENASLARLAIPVCMTPKAFASASVLNKRRQGWASGAVYTHWPHEARCTQIGSKSFVPVKLSEQAKHLIPLSSDDDSPL
jgi:hypothetical protein